MYHVSLIVFWIYRLWIYRNWWLLVAMIICHFKRQLSWIVNIVNIYWCCFIVTQNKWQPFPSDKFSWTPLFKRSSSSRPFHKLGYGLVGKFIDTWWRNSLDDDHLTISKSERSWTLSKIHLCLRVSVVDEDKQFLFSLSIAPEWLLENDHKMLSGFITISFANLAFL